MTKLNQVIVRTLNAGVFYGSVDTETGRLTDARRIWYWAGAATLSELATLGTSKPNECKFPAAVPWVVVADIIEILPLSDQAQDTLDGVSVWTEHE